MKKTLLTVAVAFAAIFSTNAQIQNYSVGQTVNDFTVTDIHGNTHTLSSITGSGQWVLLDFFFTTCGPCQQTVPIFSELHEKYGCNEGDLFCMSIDNGDSDSEVLGFENTYSISTGHSPAPAVSGTEGGGNAVVADFGPAAYPTYTLIGPDMKMKNVDIWPISSVADFEAAFANAGFSPAAMSCGAGIEENAQALNSMKLFPNPAAENTTLSVNLDAATDVEVKVYNMLGALVSTQTFNGLAGANEITINTSEFENGQYILNVSLGDAVAEKQSILNVLK